MAPPLPLSLSPHVYILESPDLSELLENSSLPPLPNILQSFSPLPQVTTRTSTLVSIPHKNFALRFSSLIDVEIACREDEEERAIRTIDWMTARINKRCQKWVQEVDSSVNKEGVRTPWWDELRRCAEGDFVPAKTEGWNHPIALILAVSTTAPNPLATITALHARTLQLPQWVDNNFLKYTLIIHPRNSPLSEEEANALFNAVKKQFGLHSYLLPLELPKSAPTIVVPALMPRLPPSPSSESLSQQTPSRSTSPSATASATLNTLKMDERDIQQTARFTREFLVMSVIPWMEKCVIEWNENFSSSRRLPSRLFSSTRRLFGSQATPAPTPPSATSSVPGRNTISQNGGPAPPPQQRRLAEFATILGDLKLAVTVWEALRKENKGGADILPMLLSPSTVIPLYAQTSLTLIHPNATDLPSHAQVRALLYAVRWEAGIELPDFLNPVLEGERWLVWAAANAEEAPSALLLAQAALMSTKKRARRRAALWYVLAASRLEKCGIKPLTMYFLRKAHDIYDVPVPKELSPSFWDSEAKLPNSAEGLEDIMSGIQHPLSRLLYTTGDVAGAVRLFLSLLRGAPAFADAGLPIVVDGTAKVSSNDKLYLDDFRVAYNYWKSSEPEEASKASLQIPFKLCDSKSSRLRFPGDMINADMDIWSSRLEDWKAYWKLQGGKLNVVPSGKVCTNDLFWVDLIMQNPLDAEINLSNVMVVVQETFTSSSSSIGEFVEVEVIKEVSIGPKASCSIPISLKSKQPAKLSITHAKYDFLAQLSTTESLASTGRRLHETALQRQQPTHAPDIVMQVEVVPADHRLTVSYVEDERLVLLQGENKSIRLWFMNSGSRPISEVWMVCGPDDEIWTGAEDMLEDSNDATEIVTSQNSLKPQEPRRISLKSINGTSALQPGDSVEVPIIFHAESTGSHELFLLFLFREDDSQPFHSTKLARTYEVQPLLDISVSAEPSQLEDHAYVLDVDMTNVSHFASVNLTQITSISPQWTCKLLSDSVLDTIAPSQCSRLLLGASHWKEGSSSRQTLDFVTKKLDNLLKGGEIDHSITAPPINIHCSHISKTLRRKLVQGSAIMNFITSGRRKFVSRTIAQVHPYIASTFHSSIFPLYNPAAVDLVLFWEIASRNITGHINVHGITIGAGHAALDKIIEDAEGAKVKRSMYAETRRENMEVLDAIRDSEWNTEMNPIVLTYKDTGPKQHDFAAGPCPVSLEFVLRNHSLTLPAQYTLKLDSKPISSTTLLPPPYFGRLTFRGEIKSSESTTIRPKLWITRAGAYGLGGWTLETSVLTSLEDADQNKRERRYLQTPSIEQEAPLIIYDSRIPQENL